MDLKKQIDKEYSEIVALNDLLGSKNQREQVCGPIFDPIKNKYPTFKGYEEESDLGLGCGFPFLYAGIRETNTVVDLGCAAVIDSFIARELVGSQGSVIGFDLTQRLIDRANSIVSKKGFTNIFFKKGDIEHLPIKDAAANVVITNGVFSLLPALDDAFAEVYRILKINGHFCIADINKKTKFTKASYIKIKEYTGCLNGINYQEKYLEKMTNAGFRNINIVEERKIKIPFLSEEKEQHDLFITTFLMKK